MTDIESAAFIAIVVAGCINLLRDNNAHYGLGHRRVAKQPMNQINETILKLQIRVAYLEAMLAAIACRCNVELPNPQLMVEIKNVAHAAIRKGNE
jgi:hypothetical protein